MDYSVRKNYELAGKIHKAAMKKAEKNVQPEKKLLNIAEELEQFLLEQVAETKKEGGLAFPVNLSVNHEAAHATPGISDETVLLQTDLLKVDIGVHIDGFIADGAKSFNFSNDHAKQIEANEAALEAALSMVKPGAEIKKVGEVVEPLLEKAGFKVVSNLTGHGVAEYVQHAPPSVPNVRNNSFGKFEDGMAIAIEPFATTGRGTIADSSQIEIFSVEEERSVRDPHARKILEFAKANFASLPFAERQLAELKLSEFSRKVGLRELVKAGVLHSYPVLVEQKGAFVSQAEKTVIIDGNEAIIIN
ncbi:MAG: type II methionyl aminopeptidase [Candidatus Diapherotrites archaeon]|uniref:Methionine aminopeptidase n=1 Tax=Candidatus Iainarchaeum sp. TaxID=3101447 RepID=A0A8T4LDV0_9ARCH|nr:type II methionyl aminopeptidase [Candidatus Diapherotrites archaeon]